MSGILSIGANNRGRDFVVGDIHGWLEPMMDALDQFDFDADCDRLFAVGDIIDRGPDSEHCLKLTTAPWFYTVRGNHEQLMFDWLQEPDSINVDDWMHYGASTWVIDGPENYFHQHPEVTRLASKLSETLPSVIELTLKDGRRLAISHSTLPVTEWEDLVMRLPHDTGVQKALLWDRHLADENFERTVNGIDLCVCGHEATSRPQRRGNCVYIDTGAALLGNGATHADGTPAAITVMPVEELFKI